MRLILLLVVPLVLFFVLRAHAQTSLQEAGPRDPGRFSMRQTEDGFLRLDTATGAVSICRRQPVDWVCKTIADDRSVLEAEIARLTAENRKLRDELASLSQSDSGTPDTLELPSKEDMDKVMSFFEQTMRRLHDMVDSFNRERDLEQADPLKNKI